MSSTWTPSTEKYIAPQLRRDYDPNLPTTCTRGLAVHHCYHPCSRERIAYLMKQQQMEHAHPRNHHYHHPTRPQKQKQKEKKTAPCSLPPAPPSQCSHEETIRQLEEEICVLRNRNRALEITLSDIKALEDLEELDLMRMAMQNGPAVKSGEGFSGPCGGYSACLGITRDKDMVMPDMAERVPEPQEQEWIVL